MQPEQGEHHDPVSEASRSGLEKLMALGVLVEAGGRYTAERARVRLAKEERAAERDRAAQVAQEKQERLAAQEQRETQRDQEKAQRQARAEQSRREREWRNLAASPSRLGEHLKDLPVQEVARHWGQAVAQTGKDRTADVVLAATEKELRARMPTLMGHYDQARRAGTGRYDSMRGAVHSVFGGDDAARSHGQAPMWWAQKLPALDRELDQELRNQAGGLDPAARARWLRAMEARGWSPESVAWAESILVRSTDQRREAQAANASAVDDPATPADERADGLVATGTATGRSDDLARDAAAEAGTAGHPSARLNSGRGGQRVVRPQQPGQPARLARLSFATPANAVLRPSNQPAPAPSRPPTPERATRRGPTR